MVLFAAGTVTGLRSILYGDKPRERVNNEVGLLLCAGIAKIHNVEIYIESELDQDTIAKVMFKKYYI